MDLKVTQLAVLKDNYIYVIHYGDVHIAVDPAKAEPVIEFCKKQNIQLDYILNTHHHPDHMEGVPELQLLYSAKVIGPHNSPHKNKFDQLITKDHQTIDLSGLKITAIQTPGHTMDHVVYHLPEHHKLFCGDVLFSMGCGRVFEGSMNDMWLSLNKIKSLGQQTMVYCAHEYTLENLLFAQSYMQDNAEIKKRSLKIKELRSKNIRTVPFLLKDELDTNPFLLAKNLESFSKTRMAKNKF